MQIISVLLNAIIPFRFPRLPLSPAIVGQHPVVGRESTDLCSPPCCFHGQRVDQDEWSTLSRHFIMQCDIIERMDRHQMDSRWREFDQSRKDNTRAEAARHLQWCAPLGHTKFYCIRPLLTGTGAAMQRSLRTMLGLGGVALVAVALVIWRGERGQLPSGESSPSAALMPSKSIGTSALSHGGSIPVRDERGLTSGAVAGSLLGQRMIVGKVSKMSGQRTVEPGTEVVVTAVVDLPQSGSGRAERSYQVRLPDGAIEWLPEGSLRSRPISDHSD